MKMIDKGSNTYPRAASVRYGGDGGAESVDGDRVQWREVVGGKETIRRPEGAEQDTRGLRSF